MKQTLTLFLSSLALMGLVACSSTPKITAQYQAGISTSIEIDAETLSDMLESEEDFVLYVFDYTCSSCIEFRPILNEEIAATELVIFSTTTSSLPSLLTIQYTPTLYTISQGKVITKSDMYHQPNSFASVSQFDRYLRSVVELAD